MSENKERVYAEADIPAQLAEHGLTAWYLEEGWIRRNGIPRSDRATVTEHFVRHGDGLTWVTVIKDPAYLTETMIRSRDYNFNVAGGIAPYPCESVTEVVRPKGQIPHHLPRVQRCDAAMVVEQHPQLGAQCAVDAGANSEHRGERRCVVERR